MSVGKTRKTNKHLPKRMYAKHGCFWYVDPHNKWHKLDPDYSTALKRYATLLGPVGTERIDLLIAKYENEVLPGLAKDTGKGRRKEFKRVRAVFGAMNPKELKGSDAWEYFKLRGANPAARHEVSALSAVMGWAVKWGVVDRNPLTNLRLPGTPPRSRYVTDEEFLAVYAAAPLMIQCAMSIALITAIRQRDVLSMERNQIVNGTLTVTASKTGKPQTFPVAGDLKAAIDTALSQSPQLRRHVIVNRAGKPYSRDGFQTQWQRAMKKAFPLKEHRYTFHDLRAKNLSDAGSLEEARQRAQHSDARITQRVYRRLPEASTVADISHLLDKRAKY